MIIFFQQIRKFDLDRHRCRRGCRNGGWSRCKGGGTVECSSSRASLILAAGFYLLNGILVVILGTCHCPNNDQDDYPYNKRNISISVALLLGLRLRIDTYRSGQLKTYRNVGSMNYFDGFRHHTHRNLLSLNSHLKMFHNVGSIMRLVGFHHRSRRNISF